MPVKLYSIDASPPARAVLLTAKAVGVELDIQEVDLFKNEQLDSKFIEINPEHTVPTLDDNGFILWDSHAINAYLVGEYGKDDSLYPKDTKSRALVDQRLHFDSGIIFPSVVKLARPIRLEGMKTIPDDLAKYVNEKYKLLDTLLNGNKWFAGQNVTIADFSLISSITSLDVLLPIASDRYPNLTAWIERCQALPYYHVNQKGLDDFRAVFEKLMAN